MKGRIKSSLIRFFEKRTINHASRLQKGQAAPDFELPDQDGRVFRLSDQKGLRTVLYFYPKDDTIGCTLQACTLRDHYAMLLEKGYQVIGISPDGAGSHKKFIAKYRLPFSLLSDTDGKVSGLYDVYAEKNIFGRRFRGVARTTFVINAAGIIEKIIDDVDTADHANQVIE